jgi:hypothetical protein
MDRKKFLKSIGIGASGLILPVGLSISSKPIKIYDNYIRGLAHYDYSRVQKELKEGDQVVLLREGTNMYDSFAIQVNYKEYRLGYVAAFENVILANMLDSGVELTAFVGQINSKRDLMERISVEIFADMIVSNSKIIENDLGGKRADDATDIYRTGPF